MNKLHLILAMSLASGGVYAQGAGGGVTTSTDPAKAAAVEQHAQELEARQSKEPSSKPAANHGSSHHAGKSTHKSSTHKSSTHKSSTHTKPAAEPKT